MSFFVHPQAICESEEIGDGTRIWAFAHVLPGARIGADCNICDHVFIENDVVLGDRVTVKSGVQLWDGIRLGHGVFVGPNATFTNDRFPRSKEYQGKIPRTYVSDEASLGANCTILPGINIGRQAMIGAGSVITRDVPPKAIVFGNPGRIRGYVDVEPKPSTPAARGAELAPEDPSPPVTPLIGGASLHRLKVVRDLRGSLSVGDFGIDVPFEPKRYFVVYEVPSQHVRGEHAHRTCEQFLICLRGSVAVVLDDGEKQLEIQLDGPHLGLYLPPMIWANQYKYTSDVALLVFASELYDAEEYIREYEEYLALVKGGRTADEAS